MVAAPITMQVLADTPQHRAIVNTILQAASDYDVLVEGVPPTAAHVEDFFTSLPPDYSADDLFPLGFFVGEVAIGVGGLRRRWNAPNKTMLGLLVLARTWPGIDRLRIGVIVTNLDALGFWRKIGYIDTGEIKPKCGSFIDDIAILEKTI